MSMLAEPKRRTKYSIDPNGTNWSKDDSKFGQKLMERMGWEKGTGLGANADGRTEHVSVRHKKDTLGVGCSKNYADNWIAHQDDFNALLSSLNTGSDDGSETKQVESLESKSQKAKGRVHYHKFTRGKDLSNCKGNDLDQVLGKRKSAPSTPQNMSQANSAANSEDEEQSKSDSEEEHNHGVQTYTSGTSVQDYFAKKMAELKKNRGISVPTVSSEEQSKEEVEEKIEEKEEEPIVSDDEPSKKKKRNKEKKEKSETTEGATAVSSSEEEKPKKKSKKKRKKSKKENDDVCEIEMKEQKKQKDSTDSDNSSETAPGPKKKKKKSKKAKEEPDVINLDTTTDDVIEIHDIAGSSSKKANAKCVDEEIEILEQPKDKKKQKTTKCDTSSEVTESKKKKKKNKKEKSDKIDVVDVEDSVQEKEVIEVSEDKPKKKSKKRKNKESDEDHTSKKVKTEPQENGKDDDVIFQFSTEAGFPGSNLGDLKGYGGGKSIGYDVEQWKRSKKRK